MTDPIHRWLDVFRVLAPEPARITQKKSETKRKQAEVNYSATAEKYVADIISGKIPSGKLTKRACERHLRDIASSITSKFPYKYESRLGNRACAFIETLPHTKGKWAKVDPRTGKAPTIKLEPWQCFIVCSLFGWVKKANGKRRFRKGRIYVPRKNAKTTLLAAIGIYMLTADREPGAEVYCGATAEIQARTLFTMVRQMCVKRPNMVKRFELLVGANSVVKNDGSIFRTMIGKPGDGDSPHCAIVDEYHEHKTSEQLDTMETGMGAREQPLSLVISTAGSNTIGPCRDDWKNCERILNGIDGFVDDTCFAIIYSIDAEDRWDCEESLRKANPNWGVSIEPDHILADMRDAQGRANQQSKFRTKHLNEWVSVKEAFFNVSEWEKLKRDIKREDYIDHPCYLAGDLASKHDLVALMQLFCLPDKRYAIFGTYWITEAALDRPENQHYRNWHIEGRLKVAGEEVTDLEEFKTESIELCGKYQVIEMPSDPNRAWGVFPALEREGVPVVEYRNVVLSMSEPMKELDALIRSGRIIHDGDPVLAWAIANTCGKIDAKDNVYPRKENDANKIDPVVATIMAIGRAMTREDHDMQPFIAW
jgi:phage terminase large subunit-like protein